MRYDENEMSTLARGVLAATLVTILAAPAFGQQTDACSRDPLTVDGTTVGVTLCVSGAPARKTKGEGRPVSVTIVETFSTGKAAFSRTSSFDFLDQSEASRTIDDVPLDRLGIGKTLHLTIVYRAGAVRLEHAMLVPGAVDLK